VVFGRRTRFLSALDPSRSTGRINKPQNITFRQYIIVINTCAELQNRWCTMMTRFIILLYILHCVRTIHDEVVGCAPNTRRRYVVFSRTRTPPARTLFGAKSGTSYERNKSTFTNESSQFAKSGVFG